MKQRQRWAIATTILGLGLGLGLHTGQIADAVQLADGTTHFEAVPRLIDATLTRQSVADSNVKYYFDLSVPADAGEPLQRVEIQQDNGRSFTQEVDFDLDDSRAFVGQRRDRGPELPLDTVRFDGDSQTLTVTFDPPIAPGTDLTLRLKAERNPRRPGVYLFGVTAYPDGDSPAGQFLGFGRFHIYDNDNDFFH